MLPLLTHLVLRYVDPLMSNRAEAYWGSNLPRLQEFKADVNPRNIFKNPQSPLPV